jgi:hypothetical protein
MRQPSEAAVLCRVNTLTEGGAIREPRPLWEVSGKREKGPLYQRAFLFDDSCFYRG